MVRVQVLVVLPGRGGGRGGGRREVLAGGRLQIVQLILTGGSAGPGTPLLVGRRLHVYLLHLGTVQVHHHHRLAHSDGHRQGELPIQEVVNLGRRKGRTVRGSLLA